MIEKIDKMEIDRLAKAVDKILYSEVLEKDIEEERRLFYVGMTRAKTSLSVYSVKSVNDKSAQASRFVRESKEPRQNNSRDD